MEEKKIREPQQKRSIEKKNKIIEAGFQLICEKGYQKTTTADIAKAAGVSTGIVYNYFKDKHDIFIAGLENCGKHLLMPMYDRFSIPFDFRESLETVIDHLMEGHRVFEGAHKEVEALVMTDEEISNIITKFEIGTTEDLVQFLVSAGYDQSDLHEKAHIIYNLVESLCHETVYHKHSCINYQRMRAIVVDMIINLLASNAPD